MLLTAFKLMVAVSNSQKYEEFTRERHINYEGEYVISLDGDIEKFIKIVGK